MSCHITAKDHSINLLQKYVSDHVVDTTPSGNPLKKSVSDHVTDAAPRGNHLIFLCRPMLCPQGGTLNKKYQPMFQLRPLCVTPFKNIYHPMCQLWPLGGGALQKYVSTDVADTAPKGDILKNLCQPMWQIRSLGETPCKNMWQKICQLQPLGGTDSNFFVITCARYGPKG